MVTLITFANSYQSKCLTRWEMEELFSFCFHVHDHDARSPGVPIYWERIGMPKNNFGQMRWVN